MILNANDRALCVFFKTLFDKWFRLQTYYLSNGVLEIVEQFTYLEIIFQYDTKFTKTEKKLSDQGRKAMFALRKNIRGMLLNHETFLSLFDC